MFMEKDYNNAKVHLQIDMMDLETEFIQHPARMQAVVECCADVMQIRDTSATLLKIEIANAAERLRVPDKDGKLPSETKINSLSLLDARVVSATEALAEAEHDLRYWQGLADSYRAKGSSLKHISELTVAGWLAPSNNRKQELQAVRNAGPTPQQFISKRRSGDGT